MDLGAGFHPELTAGENITLNSALLGRFKVDCLKIADWANLRDKLEDPVRTFSSGMVARLAFSIATDVNPDILLIDEVLSVGDQNFQAKSLERTRSLITSGGTVILVSHNLELLREECSRVIWLDSGGVKMDGVPTAVIDAYRDLQSN
jgi:ABC-type polysaccharide/polyol phosphate transport system ATPase subunit